MRIAFLSYQLPGLRMGGIGSYVRQSAAALALAGHEAHVFSIGEKNEMPNNVPTGVTLHLTPDVASRVESGDLPAEQAAVAGGGGEALYRFAIASLLTAEFLRVHRSLPFDVVEVADVDASGLPLLLDVNRPCPVVVHLHTCTAIANRFHKTQFTAEDRLIEALEAAQIHLADAVCAPTHSVIRETHPFVDPGAVQIIPHPLVCGDGEYSPPPSDGPILFVGRLEWRKGCGVITEILGEFLARHPSARFRFVGPDTSTAPGGQSVRALIDRSLCASDFDSRERKPRVSDHGSAFEQPGLPLPAMKEVYSRVEFTGELSPADVRKQLESCLFCVLPSLSENFSLAICEAMTAGRTTIVAAGTGSVEVLGDAVVVEPNSPESLLAAMSDLFVDRRRLDELSRRAFDRVRSFCDPVAVSTNRVAFYEQVIRNFDAKSAAEKLLTIPPAVAAALLPCVARMTAALMRVDEPNNSPGDRLDRICQELNGGEPASVVLYGAGKHTARLMSQRHRWERHGHRVIGLIDDHPRFVESPTHLGLPVRSLKQAVTDANRIPSVVLSTDTYEQQFWDETAELRAAGVRVFALYGEADKSRARRF